MFLSDLEAVIAIFKPGFVYACVCSRTYTKIITHACGLFTKMFSRLYFELFYSLHLNIEISNTYGKLLLMQVYQISCSIEQTEGKDGAKTARWRRQTPRKGQLDAHNLAIATIVSYIELIVISMR